MASKFGQLSHVFVYIMAAIVFAIITLFGYKAVTSLMETGDNVAFASFKSDLQSSVSSIATKYESVQLFNERNILRVPGDYDMVCFVDVSEQPVCGDDLSPLICDLWEEYHAVGYDLAQENVFLVPLASESIKLSPFKIDTDGDGKNTQSDDPYLCVDVVSNRLDFRLTGKGSYTLIAK